MQSKLPQAGTRSVTLLATIYQPLSVAATIYHPLRLGAVFANTCNRNRIEEWLSCCILCILSSAASIQWNKEVVYKSGLESAAQ